MICQFNTYIRENIVKHISNCLFIIYDLSVHNNMLKRLIRLGFIWHLVNEWPRLKEPLRGDRL